MECAPYRIRRSRPRRSPATAGRRQIEYPPLSALRNKDGSAINSVKEGGFHKALRSQLTVINFLELPAFSLPQAELRLKKAATSCEVAG